jgi:hypothetical protein
MADSASGRHVRVKAVLEYPKLLNPEDYARFIHLDSFTSDWKDLGLDDSDLQVLQIFIMAAPKASPVVPGTAGLRKMRFAPRSWKTGKRGAARVLYAHFEDYSVVVLVAAYAKNEKEDITPKDKKLIRDLMKEISGLLAQGR